MKTYLECVPCFFKQALEAVKMAGAGKAKQQKMIYELAKALPKFPLSSSPPEMGRIVYGLVKEITGKQDPYAQIKARSNRLALGVYPRLKQKLNRSRDRLLTAVELAIAGNIIDYGVKNTLNIDAELSNILAEEDESIKKEGGSIFDYKSFKRALKRAETILYLADNAGETVFDRVLIEEIKRLYKDKDIIYAVKEKPIINDALKEDAVFCGIDKSSRIISSGLDVPGTVLRWCSKSFLDTYRKADMVISKGQGNFEALSSNARREIFFLFMAKCPVITEHLHCNLRDIVLSHYPGKRIR